MTEQEKLIKWLKQAPLDHVAEGVRPLEGPRDQAHRQLAQVVGGLSHQGHVLHLPASREAELLP